MSTNNFLESELITKRINGMKRPFQLLEEDFGSPMKTTKLSASRPRSSGWIKTLAVVRAITTTEKGIYNGTGTASAKRDARLADSLLELAETRAIARSLRWASYGLEMTGAEEMSHVPDGEGPEPKEEPVMNHNGNGIKATQAQCRALFAMTRKADYCKEDIERMLSPFNVVSFQELPKEAASKLITYLQTEVA